MAKNITHRGASVRSCLLKLAKEKEQAFDLLLTRYVLERFLYRLSTTDYRNRFALKGAMLMAAWFDDPQRPTRDVDFLGFGEADAEIVTDIFRMVCKIQMDDAVIFDDAGFTVDRVRDEREYGGLRIKTNATVDGARVRVVIDIGFGDATEPGLSDTELPVLLGMPAPNLRSYAKETVIAEKFQAMVMLGRTNSRMKDFYDIWILSQSYDFAGDALARAIAATFSRRGTDIPAVEPDALTQNFADDPVKQLQWKDFLQNVAATPGALGDVITTLAGFLMPHAAKARALKYGSYVWKMYGVNPNLH